VKVFKMQESQLIVSTSSVLVFSFMTKKITTSQCNYFLCKWLASVRLASVNTVSQFKQFVPSFLLQSVLSLC